jgi:carboxylesterase type B
MDALAREPTVLSLGPHGYIQGSRLREPTTTTTTSNTRDVEKGSDSAYLVRYFGGVRYALPPQRRRWGLAQPLPDGYVYGTQTNPGKCEGIVAPCPQLNSGGDADEDCFQCNVWVPEGEVPEGGMSIILLLILV